MSNNKAFMKRALELALKGSGWVNPNPRVGAVIVKNGEIIGEGWHKQYGSAHAEIEAINSVDRADISGADLYVTLEPCNHYGKTPPCTDAIIENKFAKVFIAMKDPNPTVEGDGANKLRSAGIEVVEGMLEDEAKWENRFFIKHITSGLPYIVLKMGQSLDSNIATADGESKWITSEESRRRAHILRSSVDGILVGSNTVATDDPSLTVRAVEGHNPKRIVLDTQLSLQLTAKVFSDFNRFDTILFCSEKASETRKGKVLALAGVKLIPCELDDSGKLSLQSVVEKIGKELNMSSILVEGGSNIFSAFISEGLVDEMHTFIAPILLGQGYHTFRGLSVNSINKAPKFEIKAVSQSDCDLQIISIFKGE